MNQGSRSFDDELASLKADVTVMRLNCATKGDLQELRFTIVREIHASRTASDGKADALGVELRVELAGLRLEIEKLRVEMHAMQADLYKALYGQTWKVYGFGVVMVVAVYFATRAGY